MKRKIASRNVEKFGASGLLILLLILPNIFGQETEIRPLPPHQPLTREMTGAETHRYGFDVKENEFFQVRVEQKGVDVALKLLDASGKTLATMDSPNGKTGFETLSLIAEKAGNYVLEVNGFDAKAEKGFYVIERDVSRPATEDDKRRIAVQIEAARAKTFFDEGFALVNRGNTESLRAALIKLNEASRLYQKIDDKGELAGLTLLVSGIAFDRLGEKSEAVKFYEAALKFFQANNHIGRAAGALTNLGQLYSDTGDKQKALEYFSQSLPLLRQVGNQYGEARTLNNIGLVYSAVGKPQIALENYNLALPLFRQVGDKPGEARALTNIGAVYSSLGEKQKALKFYNQALPIFNQSGDVGGAAATLNNIGAVYSELGENRKAMEFQNQALPLLRKLGDKSTEARTLHNLGREYAGSGDPQKALELYNQALPLLREVGDKTGEGQILNSIGFTYDELGELPKALEFYNQSLPLLKQANDKAGEAASLNNIGKVYVMLGKGQESLTYLNAALMLSRQTGEPILEAKTLDNLMSAWDSLQNSRAAVFYGKQAVNKFQEVRRNIKGLDLQIQKTYLGTVAGTYRKLADLLIAQGDFAQAERILAMLKEEEFADFIRRDANEIGKLDARVPLGDREKALIERYATLAGSITEIGEEFGKLDDKKRMLSRAEQTLSAEEQKRYAELERQLADANAAFQLFLTKELIGEIGAAKIKNIEVDRSLQSHLRKWGKGTVALYTIAGADRYRVVLTTPTAQVDGKSEIKIADLNQKIFDFRAALQNPRIDPRPLGKELYDILIKPVEKDLRAANAKTLVWSLDGTLRYIPLAALSPDGVHYLVEDVRNVIITPKTRDDLTVSNADWQALGLGVSDAQTVPSPEDKTLRVSFDPLPGTLRELLAVVKDEKSPDETGVLSGRRLLNKDFTTIAFKDALAKETADGTRQYNVVHIASHFSLGSNWSNSFLLLGGGETLTLEDLNNSAAIDFGDVELITLSACNTGFADDTNGKEIDSLASVIETKSGKSILATLWSVADESTSLLMSEFYRIKKAAPKLTKADALQTAQRAMIEGRLKPSGAATGCRSEIVKPNGTPPAFKCDANAPFAHPYFWSPFVLIGNWK